ncbi:MAG TPA: hypothetical protein V6D03_07090 [Candidatus Caenarcaniphilales bacterium]
MQMANEPTQGSVFVHATVIPPGVRRLKLPALGECQPQAAPSGWLSPQPAS